MVLHDDDYDDGLWGSAKNKKKDKKKVTKKKLQYDKMGNVIKTSKEKKNLLTDYLLNEQEKLKKEKEREKLIKLVNATTVPKDKYSILRDKIKKGNVDFDPSQHKFAKLGYNQGLKDFSEHLLKLQKEKNIKSLQGLNNYRYRLLELQKLKSQNI